MKKPSLPSSSSPFKFNSRESLALDLDARDPLAEYRKEFLLPKGPDGNPQIYFCGNSLGLQPKNAGEYVRDEMRAWADLAVAGHFKEQGPWYTYHELLREPMARLVGALPHEVVMMNSLTINLHLMMSSFYRPTSSRHKILIENCAFPSDKYAVQTQIRHHGGDPACSLLVARPRPDESFLRIEDLEELFEKEGSSIALALFPGVQYLSGQALDMHQLAILARKHGCRLGLDLAHAAGNLELRLHEWGIDFAVWCSYKYLNGGPGAIGGCFIHEKHATNRKLPRLGGWWGNDPETRFQMRQELEFVPRDSADGWQISNPPILAMAPLRAALDLFQRLGIAALREKSRLLTGYLEFLLDQQKPQRYQILTPREPESRGCQLSIRVPQKPRDLLQALTAQGVVGDLREPDVIRVAPVPLYNTFHEVWRFSRILAKL